MNIKVIAGTQEAKVGFQLYEFGSVIPDKINKSLIQSMYSEDGALTVDAGIDLGEAIELTGANGSVTLVKGDGTAYTGESDADISYYDDVSFEIGEGVAPIKKPSGFAIPTIADLTDVSFTVRWTAPTGGDAVNGYVVTIDGVDGSPFAVTPNKLDLAVSGLTEKTSYDVTVAAFNEGGEAVKGVNATTAETIPDVIAPSDFADPTIGEITKSGFTVAWTPPAVGDAVESYAMVVKSYGTEIVGSPFTFGVDDTTKVLDGLAADSDFGITMTATNSAGSVDTNAVSTHTLADTIEPSDNIKPATKKTRKTKAK